jgi:hypothetical protein
MPRAHDPEVEVLRRAKIRVAARERHFRARGNDGRSRLAVSAGRAGGRETASSFPGGPHVWSQRMNLVRKGVPFKWSQGDAKVVQLASRTARERPGARIANLDGVAVGEERLVAGRRG